MSSSKPSPQQHQQQRANEWWSDGETAALIDAWGPPHVARSRGPLPAKDWRAAASATLKERYKRELAKPPPSGWRHFSRLQEFLLAGPPPGFPPKTMPPASVKKEEEEECQDEAVGGGGGSGGLLGRWVVPTRPRNGAAAWCPVGVVVTKLAEVYERVELARLEVEKEKVAMEMEKAMQEAVKLKEEKLDT
ncbi:hypothetical protein DAI22_03g142100 [Oryza sativa Japonica Group]|nr:hypothetical protein DAI22_03g142100 [Oryza sativa Japonica Group]